MILRHCPDDECPTKGDIIGHWKTFSLPKHSAMAKDTARRVLPIESEAIHRLIERVGSHFEQAVEMLQAYRGRVVVTGMGKSGIVCRKTLQLWRAPGPLPSSCIQRRPFTVISAWSLQAIKCWLFPTAVKPKSW